jgi:hypothetical protein
MKERTLKAGIRGWIAMGLLSLTLGSAAGYEGFGGAATGGSGQAIYHVTTCDAQNPPATPTAGSLRHAALQGNRYIVFDVACSTPVDFGTSWVYFRSNTTVDGTTAPAPGFRYVGTLAVGGSRCSPRCNNVIIRGMVYRRPTANQSVQPGIVLERGAHTIVIDHSSFFRCGNDCISITSNEGANFVDTRNITISRSFFNHPLRPCCGDETGAETTWLISARSRRISVIYNLVYDAARRNPWVRYDDNVRPSDTVLDLRNNLFYKIGANSSRSGGVFLWDRVRANIVSNWFRAKDGLTTGAQKRAIITCKTSGTAPEDVGACTGESPVENVYVSGNISADGWTREINAKGTTSTRQAAAFVTTMGACAAAQSVRQDVGARHKSAEDRAALNDIVLTGCTPP